MRRRSRKLENERRSTAFKKEFSSTWQRAEEAAETRCKSAGVSLDCDWPGMRVNYLALGVCVCVCVCLSLD